jgi:M6 family metalloprotease-like protein
MKPKRVKKFLVAGLVIILALPMAANAGANPKSGTACSKSGLIKEFQNKKFICVKVNKKLIWNKGTSIAINAAQSPVSEPVQQGTPKGPEEVTQKYFAFGCHARASATLQLKDGINWKDLGAADGWEPIETCPNTNPYQPYKSVTLQSGSIVRWRVYSPGNWEWFGSEETVVPVFKPSNACQLLGQDGNSNMNVGFPKRTSRLTSNGVINAVVIGVDFPDVPGVGLPATEFKEMTNGMQVFYKKMSENRVSFNFTFSDKFVRMPFESTKYELGKWSGGDPLGYLNALIANTDGEIDFSKYDVAYFLTPRTIPISSIAYGPAFPIDVQTKDGVLKNSTFSGGDAYQRIPGSDWKWMSHETGHLFGLHDLYTAQTLKPTFGTWDLMAQNWSTTAIELTSWNRYIQGWLTDRQIKCLDKSNFSKTELVLSPIERVDLNLKAIMVKLSNSKILVIESRRSEGLDFLNAQEAGVLVYTVDMAVMSQQGGWKTQRSKNSILADYSDATLKTYDSIVVDGITIEVLSQDFTGDKVRIS